MKNSTLLKIGFVLATSTVTKAQILDSIIDDPGDIAFVAYHDDIDGFSFVFLDDCPENTQIRFTDEEWTGSEFASTTTEGEVLWENTTASTILAGTVVHIENASDKASAPIMASIGTAIEDDGGFILSLTEDEIIAFTGTRSTPGVLLAMIGDTASSGNTLTGTGLTNGITALHNSAVTEGYYSGPNNCIGLSIQDCAAQINDVSNWTFGSYTYTDDVYDTIETNSVISKKTIQQIRTKYKPNPVEDKLYLETEAIILQIEVYNIVGQKINVFTPNTNSTLVNLSELNTGKYYIKIIFKNKTETFSIQKK